MHDLAHAGSIDARCQIGTYLISMYVCSSVGRCREPPLIGVIEKCSKAQAGGAALRPLPLPLPSIDIHSSSR